jgi:dihydroorotase
VTLARREWSPPATYPMGGRDVVVPMRAGGQLRWQQVES